jgi:hypothetical protein
METIKTQALIGTDRNLSLQLPQELPVGYYEIVIVLSPKMAQTTAPKTYPLRGLPITISDDFDDPMSDLWDTLAQ